MVWQYSALLCVGCCCVIVCSGLNIMMHEGVGSQALSSDKTLIKFIKKKLGTIPGDKEGGSCCLSIQQKKEATSSISDIYLSWESLYEVIKVVLLEMRCCKVTVSQKQLTRGI